MDIQVIPKVHEIIDAVIIINDEDNLIKSLSGLGPACLTLLGNVPILHYLMRQLLYAKMRNFTIFCGKHKKVIRKFFKEMGYGDYVNFKLKIDLIEHENITSVGDAIRYLDDKKFEREFLLVHGDLVTDCDFSQLMRQYQEARQTDKLVIMSTVSAAQISKHCKKYDWAATDRFGHLVSKNGTTLKGFADPQVYFCSGHVSARMQDNTDCHSMIHLIDHLLAVSEAVGEAIHVITLPISTTCVRLVNPEDYFLVTRMILRGNILRCSPPSMFCENIRVLATSGRPISTHHLSYFCSTLSKDLLPASSRLVGNVQILSASTVGDNCRLIDTVVGNRCIIGNNVILRNCVLLDDVSVGNNCLISDTFVGCAASIGHHSQIVGKSVVDHKYIVRAHTKVSGQYLSSRGLDNIWGRPIICDRLPEVTPDSETECDEDYETILHSIMKMDLEEPASLDHLRADVQKLQFEHCKDVEDMCIDLCAVLINFPLKEPSEVKYGIRVQELFQKYGALVSSFAADQYENKRLCLESVEENACSNETILEKVADVVFSMYSSDVVDEDDIRDWFKSSTLLADPEVANQTARVRANLAALMAHLDKEDSSDEECD